MTKTKALVARPRATSLTKLSAMDAILSSPVMTGHLRSYMVAEMNEENLDFVLEVKRFEAALSNDTEEKELERLAENIFNHYVKPSGSQPLNLGAATVKLTQDNLQQKLFNHDTFSHALSQVNTIIRTGIIPKFMKTDAYLHAMGQTGKLTGCVSSPKRLDDIVARPLFCAALRAHMAKGLSEENLDFLLKVQEYQQACNDGIDEAQLVQLISDIFAEFCNPNSPNALNLSGDTVTFIKDLIQQKKFSSSLFQRAKCQVTALLRHHLPSFLASDAYKKLAADQSQGLVSPAQSFSTSTRSASSPPQQNNNTLLDRILDDRSLFKSLHAYMSKEFNEENLDFLMAVRDYNAATADGSMDLKMTAQSIYDEFLSPSAPRSLGLGASALQHSKDKLAKQQYDKTTFQRALQEVKAVMRSGILPAFMETSEYHNPV
eukprot:CAMPEP_0175141264 /NCGR_PEP_ID=MMETSP0087-20121206/12009_1 /TAXON_ID=136419 /ORGANISM="Unknown Unknown, Strain D1" /LENGTH=431 /DNA_ID=CAMNT_0016424661 /DNA_START=282 /DNA_END=1577 /DNA_ORIENTATION=-